MSIVESRSTPIRNSNGLIERVKVHYQNESHPRHPWVEVLELDQTRRGELSNPPSFTAQFRFSKPPRAALKDIMDISARVARGHYMPYFPNNLLLRILRPGDKHPQEIEFDRSSGQPLGLFWQGLGRELGESTLVREDLLRVEFTMPYAKFAITEDRAHKAYKRLTIESSHSIPFVVTGLRYSLASGESDSLDHLYPEDEISLSQKVSKELFFLPPLARFPMPPYI